VPLLDHVREHRTRYAFGASLLVPLAVAALFVPFRSSFTNVGAALVLVALIEALAIVGHRLGGVVATLSAAIWFDFFLTVPYERFTINDRNDLETTITLVVVGIIVTELAARSHHHRHVASEESGFVTLLASTAARVSATDADADVVTSTCAQLARILGLRACEYEAQVSGPPYAQIREDGSVIHVGMRWPAGDFGLPGPQAEIACVWRGQPLGRFVLTPTAGFAVTTEQRIVAVALVNVVASRLHEHHAAGPSK
jgi:hypothetical protein